MNFNCLNHIFIHSLVHYEAEKTMGSSVFDFLHDFKTTKTVQAYEINVKKPKILIFSTKML